MMHAVTGWRAYPFATVTGRHVWAGAILLGGLLGVLAAPAFADRVVLKSGEAFTGTISEQNDQEVVLKTISGTMKIPRSTIQSIEQAGDSPAKPDAGDKPEAPAPKIVPIPVEPPNAAKATEEAKRALVAGDWLKAGGLLEGLLALDEKTFKYDDRLAATGALITCYLQVKDAQGAATAIARRAQLASDPNDKRRLVAAAEALRTINSVEIDGKTLSRFEEVVTTAMAWKANQCLADAKEAAAKATRLNERAQLERAATGVLKRLAEADVYMPGFSAAHQTEALGPLITNILEGARAAMEYCKKTRPELTQTRLSSIASKAAAAAWNSVGKVYLDRRQAAEDALRSTPSFAAKYKLDGIYEANKGEIATLLADCEEYQYYPKGTGGGYYGYYDSDRRLRIQLRSF